MRIHTIAYPPIHPCTKSINYSHRNMTNAYNLYIYILRVAVHLMNQTMHSMNFELSILEQVKRVISKDSRRWNVSFV